MISSDISDEDSSEEEREEETVSNVFDKAPESTSHVPSSKIIATSDEKESEERKRYEVKQEEGKSVTGSRMASSHVQKKSKKDHEIDRAESSS